MCKEKAKCEKQKHRAPKRTISINRIQYSTLYKYEKRTNFWKKKGE